MPTYQYACTACDERLEAVQSFTDAPLTECPACSGALRKVFSAVGVVFKGSGFYKNDSRPAGKGESTSESKSSGDATTSTSSGDSNTSSSSDSKADSKADSKTGSKADSKTGSKTADKPTSKPAAAAPASKSA